MATKTANGTRGQVSWADYPFEYIGALVTAGTGTWVALAGVDYRTAHSMRTRLRLMQDGIRHGSDMPPKLVSAAKRVHWYVEDDQGERQVRRGDERLRKPVWKLIGAPSMPANTGLRLPKNVEKLVEEAVAV